MSILEDTNKVQKSLDDAIRELVEAQFQLLQQVQQSNAAFAAALDALASAMAAPRQLITDESGNPVAAVIQPQQGN